MVRWSLRDSHSILLVKKRVGNYHCSVTCEGNERIVKSQAYIANVELLNKNKDWVLSDNYFDTEAVFMILHNLDENKIVVDRSHIVWYKLIQTN